MGMGNKARAWCGLCSRNSLWTRSGQAEPSRAATGPTRRSCPSRASPCLGRCRGRRSPPPAPTPSSRLGAAASALAHLADLLSELIALYERLQLVGVADLECPDEVGVLGALVAQGVGRLDHLAAKALGQAERAAQGDDEDD